MDCSEVMDQLADYLDEDERAELCREIEAHLLRCRDCKLHVDTIKKVIVLYQEDAKRIELPFRTAQRLEEAMALEYRRRDVGAD